MFSVLFPGQGSQSVGMGKNLYQNYPYIKLLFNRADDILKKKLSKMILEGPNELLFQTENTQPAIFLVGYSIFEVIKKETSFNIDEASFFAGHSLGEYTALACAESINFEQTIMLLDARGKSMQQAVPRGKGGMLAVLGSDIKKISDILKLNENNFKCFVANDNSPGQIVVSGYNSELDMFSDELKKHHIKNVRLSVSAPFHCNLMKYSTKVMTDKIMNTNFKTPKYQIISNVTAQKTQNPNELKKLLIQQIEKPVRWRETIINMINSNVEKFVEIGPGKVLSGLVKRINKDVKIVNINDLEDFKNL